MLRSLVALLLFSLIAVPAVQAQEKPATGDGKKADPSAGEAKLPAGVLNFHGKVTGTVQAVDPTKSELKVKVTSAAADPEKSKATKPESLAGMIITVTPLAKQKADGTPAPDEASVAYIKGAKAGDPVTLEVRASSKGVVFRLLKVPAAGGK